MDLNDSFTDKLFKRSKARKDYLKVKMNDSISRKKRTILLEELQIPSENNNKELKKSSKPLSIELLTSVKEKDSTEEIKENISVKHQESMESNYMSSEPTEEETFLRAKSLAESKKKPFPQDGIDERKSQSSHLVDNPTSIFPSNRTELCSIRDRLARLAVDINGWEDNLSRSTTSSSSSTEDACSTVAKKVENMLNRSFEPSNLPVSARRAIFEKAARGDKVQSKKQAFKSKVSVAQQAAMFENAPKNKVRFRTFHQKPSNVSSTKNVRSSLKPPTPQSSAVLKGIIRKSSALTKSPTESATNNSSESSLGFSHDSHINPSAASTKTVTKPLTASPAKSCHKFTCDNSTRASAVLTRNLTSSSTKSPSKSSPAFRYGSATKPEANTASFTTPTKSFIPKLIMSPSQPKWTKTARTEPEKKLPFSSLVDHWEKLSSSSNVTIQ